MRKSVFALVAYILTAVLLVCGCVPSDGGSLSVAPTEASQSPVTEPPATEPPEEPSKAELLLSQLTQREKVAQLFIVAPETLVQTQPGGTWAAVTAVNDLLQASLEEYPVGGVILFGENVVTPQQLTALNMGLQIASDIPLFIATDEEGGRVARIGNNSNFSVKKYTSAAAVGAAGNADDGLEMGKTIGTYLHEYRFNLDFAPVADVYTNPQNTVIGNRAFSTDAATAAVMAEAAAKGMREAGIIPTFKHFPGHGDTAQDSHNQLAFSNKTIDEMRLCEWLPFMKATDADMVMVGHIACPNITGDMTPATLSSTMVTQHLRGTCGFDGLVITDAMNMKAITDTYGAGNAAVMAIQAGCDIILMPGDFKAAFDAVLTAAEDGTISPERLDESVLRILEYKFAYGVISMEEIS